MKNEIINSIFRPQGNIARYFDSAFLLFGSITVALVYYSINFELCTNDKCSDLVITKYWVSSSVFYLIFSVSLFITSVFVFKNRELPRIYSFAITVGFGSAVVLSGMLLFGIVREIGLNT